MKTRTSARWQRKLAVALGTIGAVLVVLAQPASASVSNPGEFTATLQAGSTLTLQGDPDDRVFLVGTPACADGTDNDLDGNIDGTDGQCDSTSDANERLDNVQAYVAPTIVTDIDADGDITLDPADITFQQTELCVPSALGTSCLGVLIDGTGPIRTGTIDPTTGAISIDVEVTVFLSNIGVNTPGFQSPCRIGPVSGNLSATDYSETTGAATLTNGSALPVPAVTDDCGSTLFGIVVYRDVINTELELPTTADVSFSVIISNSMGQHPQD